MVVCEPTNFEEANKSKKWQAAMKDELIMIEKKKAKDGNYLTYLKIEK